MNEVPTQTDEDRKKIQKRMAMARNFSVHLPAIIGFAETLKGDGYAKVGAVGYCSGKSTGFIQFQLCLLTQDTIRRKVDHGGWC